MSRLARKFILLGVIGALPGSVNAQSAKLSAPLTRPATPPIDEKSTSGAPAEGLPLSPTRDPHVRIGVPSGWVATPPAQLKGDAIAMMVRKGWLSNISIVVTAVDLGRPMPIKDGMKDVIALLKRGDASFTLIEKVDTTLAGRPACRIVYDTSGPVRTTQIYIVDGAMGYILTYGARPVEHGQHKPLVDLVFRSFELNGVSGYPTEKPAAAVAATPVALTAAATAKPSKPKNAAASTQPVEKSAARVRLAYGDDWEVVPSAKLPPQTVAMITHKGDASVTIKTTTIGPLDARLTLKDVVTSAVSGTKQKMQDFKLIEQVETTLDGRPATRLLYEGRATGGVVRAMQFYTVQSSMCYIVTYAAPADRFEKYTKPAEQVIATFRVGGPKLVVTTAPATLPATPGELVTYSPLAGGYTIRYPKDWDVMANPLSTVAVLFREDASGGQRPATVSVSKPRPAPQGTTAIDLVGATVSELKKQVPDLKVLRKGAIKLAGESGYELVIEGTFKGHSPARMAEQFVIVKGVFYHLNYTTAPAAYDRLRPVFESMAASFEVSGKQ